MQYLASYRRNEGIAWNWELFFFLCFAAQFLSARGFVEELLGCISLWTRRVGERKISYKVTCMK